MQAGKVGQVAGKVGQAAGKVGQAAGQVSLLGPWKGERERERESGEEMKREKCKREVETACS